MADQPAVASVIKRGELCVQITLSRVAAGLQVTCKAHNVVEEFMRNLSGGTGRTIGAGEMGRYWSAPDTKPLQAYYMAEAIPITGGADGFRLDRLGYPLSGKPEELGGITNLSFLRLVGISEGIGVSFGLKGVYSLQAVREMRDCLAASARRFYIDYIRPVDLVVQVSTQELQM